MTCQLPPLVCELSRRENAEQHAEVYHAELDGDVLRVQIDAAGGTSLEACARFSHALSAELEASDALPGRHVLEVSSPGIERRLYRPADFAHAAGALVRVRTRQSIREGRLLGVDDSSIRLTCPGSDPAETISLPYSEIFAARAVVRDDELFLRKGRPKACDPLGPGMVATEAMDQPKGKH